MQKESNIGLWKRKWLIVHAYGPLSTEFNFSNVHKNAQLWTCSKVSVMRVILAQMTLKNGCQFQTFPTRWDNSYHMLYNTPTQCKHTIHVHNWDIYGIFHGCHVNLWGNQAIKSHCQQAKTVTLQKNSSCWHETLHLSFQDFFPAAFCLMLFTAFELVF